MIRHIPRWLLAALCCLTAAAAAGTLLYALYLRLDGLRPPEPEALPAWTAQERLYAPETAENALNLNAATLEELRALPGIGDRTAEAILALREELGGFRYPEDLLLVRGIGAAKLEAIYGLVTVEPTE